MASKEVSISGNRFGADSTCKYTNSEESGNKEEATEVEKEGFGFERADYEKEANEYRGNNEESEYSFIEFIQRTNTVLPSGEQH
ncbi:unnamed protein product [Ceratitis capitata]|uniref:(Mediterranean fruit fly) hypothetical protein n=1 Tax=Ceratitis capitata TaxID=7213 RepID=A0A811VH91_CERCA|nr:unnamed protein product [Ceratitis capitata]